MLSWGGSGCDICSSIDVGIGLDDLCTLSSLHSADNLLKCIHVLLGEVICFNIFMLRHEEHLKYYLLDILFPHKQWWSKRLKYIFFFLKKHAILSECSFLKKRAWSTFEMLDKGLSLSLLLIKEHRSLGCIRTENDWELMSVYLCFG